MFNFMKDNADPILHVLDGQKKTVPQIAFIKSFKAFVGITSRIEF